MCKLENVKRWTRNVSTLKLSVQNFQFLSVQVFERRSLENISLNMGKKTKSERRLAARQKRERIQVLEDSRDSRHPFHVFHPDEVEIIMMYKSGFETFEFQYLKICRSVYSHYIGARGTLEMLKTPEEFHVAAEFSEILHPLHRANELADASFTTIVELETFTDIDVANEKRIRKMVTFFKINVPWFEDNWETLLKSNPFEGIEVWKKRFETIRGVEVFRPIPEIPEIFTYMCYRAEREEKVMALHPRYFVEKLEMGIMDFYGVKTDQIGNVILDLHNPEAFQQFGMTK